MKELYNFIFFLSRTTWCADPWLISRCMAISFTVTRRFSFTMSSAATKTSGVTTRCAWPGWGQSVREQMLFMNFPVHSYTAVVTDMRHLSELSFFDKFRWVSLFHYIKNRWQNAILLWYMLQARPPFLHYYCTGVLHSCIVLPPVVHSSNHRYHCCQLTRQFKCVWNFYSTFKNFHLSLPRL